MKITTAMYFLKKVHMRINITHNLFKWMFLNYKCYILIELKVVFQSRKRLSTLFTFKNKVNKILHTNLVYKFKCNICNDIHYGETKRHFKVKACEHLGITCLTGKKEKAQKKVQYLIFDHNTSHNASFDGFETLVKECDEFRLLLRESLLIVRDMIHLRNRYVNSILIELFS